MSLTESVQTQHRTPAGLAVTAILALAGAAAGQLTMTEVGADRGVRRFDSGPGYGTGVAVADFDDDGDHDFFVPNGRGAADQLYVNDGSGHFDEQAAARGVASTETSRSALWVDFDGDGALDLVVAGDCFHGDDDCVDLPLLRFHRQRADGTFADVTAAMGLADDGVTEIGQHRAGFVAGDLNGDGWLDLVVGVWNGPALVLMNDGGAGFVDASATTGIGDAAEHHWQPGVFDVDGDGWLDLYYAIDFEPNRLWINRRDGTFEDIAPAAGVDNLMNDMGLTLGDYDNDGDLDPYVTEISEFDNHNVLFRNDTVDTTPAFTEVAVDAGVAYTGFGWGATFFDGDNDGWLDLGVTNGWFNGIGYDDPSVFFYNLGTDPVTFEDRAAAVGFDDEFWGAALVAFDMDRDGDLDVLQTCNRGPVRLLENDVAAANHWLVVRPRAAPPNTRAIGATVRATAHGRTMTRLVTAGTSHMGQEPAEAHFGLGEATVVERVLVAWPDGAQSVRTGVAVDDVLTITRSPCVGTADLDGDGVIDSIDLHLLLGRWGPCPRRCPHDVDRDGSVGLSDVLRLMTRWGPCPRG